MESLSLFLDLPLLPINKILTFLNAREVYYILTRLCRKLNHLINSSVQLPLQFIARMITQSPENSTRLQQIPKERLMEFLKKISSEPYDFELPYFGFKTDGGCYECDSTYFMDRVFQSQYGGKYSAYSSLDINECNIEGVLAFDYLESKEIVEFYQPISEDDFKLVQSYKLYCQKDRSNLELVLAKASNSTDRLNVELSYFPLGDITAIITSIELKRPRNYTCLTKTIVLYSSEEKIEFSDPVLQLFSGAKTVAQILSTYQAGGKDLPSIEATNIDEMKKYACDQNHTPKASSPDKTNVVLFSNKQKAKVQVVAWMRITDPSLFEIQVDLKKSNYFTGKYVAAKLLDRDITEIEDSNPNFDLKSLSLKGFLFPPNESLANAFTYDQSPTYNPEKILRFFEPYSQNYSDESDSDFENGEYESFDDT